MHEGAAAVEKIRILYILPSLGIGGAERQLYYLLRDLDRTRFEASLMVFYHGGAMHAEFAGLPDVRLFDLHKKSGMDFAYLVAAARIMRSYAFDVIHACNVSARLVGLFWPGGAVCRKPSWLSATPARFIRPLAAVCTIFLSTMQCATPPWWQPTVKRDAGFA